MNMLQVSEYERMTKDVNRSAYTRKILEIVANIKKQKQEIDKVEIKVSKLFLVLYVYISLTAKLLPFVEVKFSMKFLRNG